MTRGTHPFQVGKQVVSRAAGCILDDDIEKIGDGGRRRLQLLPQERGQRSVQALFGYVR
ncbi:MAG TPA: hypothetical protein VK210_06585 [Terriglobia bacterium]|nr:hypothetical protein [Terriglobia bacterium]